MAYPVTVPVLTQAQSVDALTEAEAGIAQCMADFLCNEILPGIIALTDVETQVQLSKTIYNVYACKEEGMSEVVSALANKTLADKGIVPNEDNNSCSSEC